MQKLLLSFSFLGFFVITNPALALQNYIEVNQNVFRGARPSSSDYKILKKDGVKTILNIENNVAAINKEKKAAKYNKLELIISPMEWDTPPDPKQVDEILALMKDSTKFPVFLHCKHGQDRTGLIVGLYRVEVEGWKAEDAYHEMLKDGFHPEYKALDDYFRQRTGFTGN